MYTLLDHDLKVVCSLGLVFFCLFVLLLCVCACVFKSDVHNIRIWITEGIKNEIKQIVLIILDELRSPPANTTSQT